jgi:hypothetical protein
MLVPKYGDTAGAAHAWAARGHLLNAQARLDDQAREHAGKSSLQGD